MNTELLKVSTQKELKKAYGFKNSYLIRHYKNVLNALDNASFKDIAISGDKLTF